MGRKRQKRVLDAYIGETKVGQLTRAPNGEVSFRYDRDWLSSDLAFPISLSMPLSDRVWSGSSALNYFDGLLPNGDAFRQKIATLEGIESAEIFDLLTVIGRDCVGALVILPEGRDPGDPKEMSYRPVSEDEIIARLDSLHNNPLGLHPDDDDFRISIPGIREKTAFLWADNQWQLPLGSTPTSHIFKPSMKQRPTDTKFSDTPWNEWLCLTLCRAFGIEAAKASVHHFEDKPVVVLERFDRVWKQKVLYRLPQEDVCQALGFSPNQRYQSAGCPGMIEIFELLNGAIAPYQDRRTFMKSQILFWLLAAIDNHFKNFSIFLAPAGYRLAPLYDVMSIAPYSDFPAQKTIMAMPFGDKRQYRLSQIHPRLFRETGKSAGMHAQDTDEILSELVDRKDKAVAVAETLAAEAGAPESTSGPIFDGLMKRLAIIESDPALLIAKLR